MTTTTTTMRQETRVEPALNTLEDYLAWVETLVEDGADLQPLVNMLLQEKFIPPHGFAGSSCRMFSS